MIIMFQSSDFGVVLLGMPQVFAYKRIGLIPQIVF